MSPPHRDRGAIPGQGEPLENDAAAKLQVPRQDTTRLGEIPARRAELRNVYADGVQVRGTRGRDRLLLFVRCWMCGRTHQHGAKTDFVSGKRTAACGRGAYVVMLGAVAGRVAA